VITKAAIYHQETFPLLCQRDREDLALIAQLNPEYVAASFVGSANDIRKIRDCLRANGNSEIKIISKIERPVALKNLDEIIKETDSIMVARGDLGVEIPPNEVPVAQKDMIARCNKEGKAVIVATQMLESMTEQSRPTRAEANDVFNAVLDGADAVMLSGETSVGKYPVQAVKYMDTIAATAEKYIPERKIGYYTSPNGGVGQAIGHAVATVVDEFYSNKYSGKILVISDDASEVLQISKYRAGIPIVVLTSSLRVAREANMIWGARSIHAEEIAGKDLETRISAAVGKVVDLGLLQESDHVIIVSSSMVVKNKKGGLWMGVYSVSSFL